MAQLLESFMLICFGCSWPISVVRNIRSHSAKSMSLGFILLIIAGYTAGIAAKVCTKSYSYVLAVYIFNLLAVTANLVVYFINRTYDRRAEQEELSTREITPEAAK